MKNKLLLNLPIIQLVLFLFAIGNTSFASSSSTMNKYIRVLVNQEPNRTKSRNYIFRNYETSMERVSYNYDKPNIIFLKKSSSTKKIDNVYHDTLKKLIKNKYSEISNISNLRVASIEMFSRTGSSIDTIITYKVTYSH